MKLWLHALLLALLAIGAGILSLKEPQFGDDFTYWTYGYNVHEQGIKAWTASGFHQLRWPVWGMCWLGQGIFGYGLASYYFTPFVVLVSGALCAFAAGWHLFKKLPLAWCCGALFLFHPLVDSTLTRPYPDIGEGVLGAIAIFAWWKLMHAETRKGIALSSLVCGLFLFLAEENRFTGLFFVPLLGCLTVLFFPRRFVRVLLPIAVFAVLLGGQMLFYHIRFGNWKHFITANQTGAKRSGTDAIPALWSIPFRFLDVLHKGSGLLSFYAIFAALGLWFGWTRYGKPGRVVVAWFILLYLAFACAPQQLWPFRPMVRVTDRFLSCLAIPYAILTTFGLAGVLNLALRSARTRGWVEAMQRRTVLTCGVATVLLATASVILNRGLFTLGYVPEFAAYMRALPPHAVVFTHSQAEALAHLVDSATASKIRWMSEDKWITEPNDKQIDRVENGDPELGKPTEFWYVRKLVMLRFAKRIITEDENMKLRKQPPLAPWFDAPEKDWKLSRVFARSDVPDIVLYSRRTAETPPPLILTHESPELKGLLPPLPWEWKKGKEDYHKNPIETKWTLPQALRGKNVRVELEAESADRDAFAVIIAFGKDKFDDGYLLKPYFFPEGGKEFVCFPIPADVTECRFRVRFNKGTDWVRVKSVRIIAD